MDSQQLNIFDPDERGLDAYRNLKADLAQDPKRLLVSLAVFVRIVLTENGGRTRWREFNRYDLLNPVPVHRAFPQLTVLGPGVEIARSIEPTAASIAYNSQEAFLESVVVRVGPEAFTVQDFISVVAYHRCLHNEPDDARLAHLYKIFVEPNQQAALDMYRAIAQCLVAAYEPVYEHFEGPKPHLFCGVRDRQPQIVESGKMLSDGARFDARWLQSPLVGKPGNGLRVSLQIKLAARESPPRLIFSVGHRDDEAAIFECLQEGDRVVARLRSKKRPDGRGSFASIRSGIRAHMARRHFVLEVAAYPSGDLSLGIDGELVAHAATAAAYCVANGKLVLGGDLDGNRGGRFSLKSCVLEHLDGLNNTSRIACMAFVVGLPDYRARKLPPAAKTRPNLLLE